MSNHDSFDFGFAAGLSRFEAPTIDSEWLAEFFGAPAGSVFDQPRDLPAYLAKVFDDLAAAGIPQDALDAASALLAPFAVAGRDADDSGERPPVDSDGDLPAFPPAGWLQGGGDSHELFAPSGALGFGERGSFDSFTGFDGAADSSALGYLLPDAVLDVPKGPGPDHLVAGLLSTNWGDLLV